MGHVLSRKKKKRKKKGKGKKVIKTKTPKRKTKNNQFIFSSFCPYKYLQEDFPPPPPEIKKEGEVHVEIKGWGWGWRGKGREGPVRGREGAREVSPVCLLPPLPLRLPLLGAGTLQHTQVVVLFGHTQLEAAEGVVEAQGGILGRRGAGEDGHNGV